MGRGLSSLDRSCPWGQRHTSLLPWRCEDGCLHVGAQQSDRQQAGSSHTYPGPASPWSPAPGSLASHNYLLKISFPTPTS